MRTYWHGMCDQNHSWVYLQHAGEPEPPAQASCPEGHSAVVLKRMPAADVVAVTIDPAARVADEVTGQIIRERHYFITVASLVTDESRRSERTWTDREVLTVAQRLLGRSTAQAWALMDALEAPTSR